MDRNANVLNPPPEKRQKIIYEYIRNEEKGKLWPFGLVTNIKKYYLV